jgi:hypothetical protein
MDAFAKNAIVKGIPEQLEQLHGMINVLLFQTRKR